MGLSKQQQQACMCSIISGVYCASSAIVSFCLDTGIAEMLAMEMKSCGAYVSRGLSFKQAEV